MYIKNKRICIKLKVSMFLEDDAYTIYQILLDMEGVDLFNVGKQMMD